MFGGTSTPSQGSGLRADTACSQALDSRLHNTLILSLFGGRNFLRTSFLGLATGQIEIGDVIYFFPS